MQTSLSPSVCRAFLGCQIEKAVDELNLTKKIISCHPSTFVPSGPCGLQCCSSTAHTDVLQGGEEVGALFWDVLQLSGLLAGDVKESRNDSPTRDLQMAAASNPESCNTSICLPPARLRSVLFDAQRVELESGIKHLGRSAVHKPCASSQSCPAVKSTTSQGSRQSRSAITWLPCLTCFGSGSEPCFAGFGHAAV